MTAGQPPTRIDRYAIYGEFASGGTATVHFGRLVGPGRFGRTVAIKRLRANYAEDPEFMRMLIDEARLSARISHQNVVQTLDVLVCEGKTYIVMEYVRGVPLSLLVKRSAKRGLRIDPHVTTALMSNVLHGLHAAHEATDEQGQPLGIVHRDVSPQNVLVGVDGSARVIDFGIAKASNLTHATREGYVKGKLAYMSPEQFGGGLVDRRTDVFAAGVLLWELLTGQRLFGGGTSADIVAKLAGDFREPPSARMPDLGPAFDELTLRSLQRDADARFPTARAMAMALEECWPMAPPSEIAEWVAATAGDVLEVHRQQLGEIEAGDHEGPPPMDGAPGPVEMEQGEVTSRSAAHPGSMAGEVPGEAPVNAGPSEDPAPAEAAEEEMSPRPGVRLRAVVRLAALAAAVAAIGWGSWLAGRREWAPAVEASDEPRAASSLPARPEDDAGAPAAASVLSEPPPARPGLPTVEPSDERAQQRAATGVSVALRAPPARAKTETTAAPKGPPEECSPPYRVDAHGIKTYKVECL